MPARFIFPDARDCANSIPLADFALNCRRLALSSRGFPCEISPAAVPLHCTCSGEIHKRTIPHRPSGTSCRSLSAWQATAQLPPLVRSHISRTFVVSASPFACDLAPFPFKPPLPCYTLPTKVRTGRKLSLRRPCGARGFWLVFLTWRVFLAQTPPRSLRSALAATPSFSRALFPALAGRFISSDEGHGDTPATRLSGNAETFAVMPHARRK